MKQIVFLFTACFLSMQLSAQKADVQKLQLSISTPQPRLGQEFFVLINIDPMKKELAKSLKKNMKFSSENSPWHCDAMDMVLLATEKGKQTIGPLEFTFNGVDYVTNKAEFEVIDALPQVTEGLWMRKAAADSNMVHLIIEQRMLTQDSKLAVKLKTDSLPAGIMLMNTDSRFSNEQIPNTNGSSTACYLYYAIYTFKIQDATKHVALTKDNFLNVPEGFTFSEVEIN